MHALADNSALPGAQNVSSTCARPKVAGTVEAGDGGFSFHGDVDSSSVSGRDEPSGTTFLGGSGRVGSSRETPGRFPRPVGEAEEVDSESAVGRGAGVS